MNTLLARQPIFDKKERIFGYEIASGDDLEQIFKKEQEAKGEGQGAGEDFKFWFHLLSKENRTFLNLNSVSALMCLDEIQDFTNTVFALHGDIEPDKECLSAVRQFKARGCLFSLDGLKSVYSNSALLKEMNYIQIEMQDLNRSMGDPDFNILHQMGLKVLVRNIATHDEFNWVRENGADLFKGSYFKTPVIEKDLVLPVNQVSRLQLLKEIRQEEISFQHLEQIIEKDPTLTFKLMQFINSSHFGTRFKIRSVKHGLTMLGEVEIKKWATMVLVSLLSESKPPELLTTALVRARFCEAMSQKTGQGNLQHECFFLGLVSVLDAMLNRPMEILVKDLPVSSLIIEALLGSHFNQMSLLLKLIVAYEDANWFQMADMAHRLKIQEDIVVACYFDALEFANQSLET